MSRPTLAQDSAATMFSMPEDAHVCLVEMRNHLRLLAMLTDPDGNTGRPEATFQAHALAWCFSRLERDVDAVVQATTVSSDYAPV